MNKYLQILKQGADVWNKWREENPNIRPNFSELQQPNLNLYFRADLSNLNFENCDLSFSKLEGANLENSIFKNSTLRGSSFRKAYCKNTDFSFSDLSETNFYRSNLENANMQDCNLQNSNFEIDCAQGLNLTGASINNIKYIDDEFEMRFLGQNSALELALANGLDKVAPESQVVVLEYLKKVWNYAFDTNYKATYENYDANGKFGGLIEFDSIPELRNVKLFNKAIEKINALIRLYELDKKAENENIIIEVVQNINAGLLKYFQKNPKKIYNISWRGFEELIAELLSYYGWQVELTAPTKDNGYDIFAIYKDLSGINHHWLIECKKWAQDKPVGVDIVRSLYGVKTDMRVGNALLATTSNFTKGAKDFKRSHYDLDLVDYQGIVNWLNEYKLSDSGRLYIKENRLIKK